ncbi:hypothetical protein F2Q69_00055113 [Brassica cretica]|uniref:Uncharacterized protein n=1 Tax=Brassica cretica TaxID=69181 RepID=A0A8S9MQ25_BRACR|nr:hypothetical protein F2Q69_00055113 [Brassica cretica]
MGMIFIPCYKGYSHKPEEYSSPEDMSNGVKVDDAWLETIQYDHCDDDDDDDDNDNDVGPGFIPLNLHVLRLNLQHQALTS